MDCLRDLLNAFNNIAPHLLQPIISAIDAAEEGGEDHIITPLTTLIVLLDQGYNSNDAVNRYMTEPATRYSATRKFFYPHTLPGNLYPEDEYICPPPPGPFPTLQPSHIFPQGKASGARILLPPRIDSFFNPEVSEAIAAMAYQVPHPDQAQAPSVIPRSQ